MSKRLPVIAMLVAMFGLLLMDVNSGKAQDGLPPGGDITTLYRAADIYAGANGSAPEDLVVFSGALYFGANGNDGAGRELWKYSPPDNPVRVADINPGLSSSYPYYLTVYNGALYFGANGNDGAGNELWKYTPIGGPQRVADIYPGSTGSSPGHLAVFNDALYFSALGDDGAGTELWRYDPVGGAVRVDDIFPGSSSSGPLFLIEYNDALYFSASDGESAGRELWMFDPINGARQVEEINQEVGSFPAYLAVYNSSLYFSATGNEGAGTELWMYDPINGSQLVADIYPGSNGSNPGYLIVYNGTLYFSAYSHDNTGTELWKYDSVNGVDRLADIYPGSSGSLPSYLEVFNGSLYFQANGGDGAGAELWQYGNTSTAVFRSVKSQDGWVLESGETTGVGGSLNSTAGALRLGDDSLDRQYRAILSFNTSTLPDNAVVTGGLLAMRRKSISGTNPFTDHGNIKADIRNGVFGIPALEVGDFQASATRNNVGTITNNPDAGNWYLAKLSVLSHVSINRVGLTQFRLRFYKDDNDNSGADIISFYSGDDLSVANRPLLMIVYYVP